MRRLAAPSIIAFLTVPIILPIASREIDQPLRFDRNGIAIAKYRSTILGDVGQQVRIQIVQPARIAAITIPQHAGCGSANTAPPLELVALKTDTLIAPRLLYAAAVAGQYARASPREYIRRP